MLKRYYILTVLLFVVHTGLFAQAEDVFRARVIGVWKWDSEYVCGHGTEKVNPPEAGKEHKLIFYPDLTIEFYKGNQLIRKSRYSITKIRSANSMRASYKLKSNLFKGYAIIDQDRMILSKCSLDGYKTGEEEEQTITAEAPK